MIGNLVYSGEQKPAYRIDNKLREYFERSAPLFLKGIMGKVEGDYST